jgi:hypothetical protein
MIVFGKENLILSAGMFDLLFAILKLSEKVYNTE